MCWIEWQHLCWYLSGMPGLNPKAGAPTFSLQSFKGFQPRQTWCLTHGFYPEHWFQTMRKCCTSDQGNFISTVVLSDLGFYFWHPWPSYKMANLSSWDFILVTLGIPKPQASDFISAMIPMSSLPRTKASQTHSPSWHRNALWIKPYIKPHGLDIHWAMKIPEVKSLHCDKARCDS